MSSVQRQLNLYGFKCINRGEDKGAFYHPRFKRGDWDVVKKITRYSPAKRSCDSPIFGPEKSSYAADDFDNLTPPVTNPAFPNNGSISEVSFGFHQSSIMNPAGFVQQSYGFHFDATNNPWYPTNIYGHLGYPMDFHNGAHFVSTFSASAEISSDANSTMTSKMAVSTSVPVSSIVSNKAPIVVNKDDRHIDEESNKKSFVNVNNDVVLVDSYFDLDAELNMFNEVGFSRHTTSPKMCEIGINTDISQAYHNLSDILKFSGTTTH